MTTIKPGSVVSAIMAGAVRTKRRPSVVLSSELYHDRRPDLILGVLTSQVDSANTPLDYVLQDWEDAGLRRPTAFRCYFGMTFASDVRPIGELSGRDWEAVRERVRRALEVGLPTDD